MMAPGSGASRRRWSTCWQVEPRSAAVARKTRGFFKMSLMMSRLGKAVFTTTILLARLSESMMRFTHSVSFMAEMSGVNVPTTVSKAFTPRSKPSASCPRLTACSRSSWNSRTLYLSLMESGSSGGVSAALKELFMPGGNRCLLPSAVATTGLAADLLPRPLRSCPHCARGRTILQHAGCLPVATNCRPSPPVAADACRSRVVPADDRVVRFISLISL
mmetsp:Transcript_10943/g.30942  ORF Transcript_10943/g.30942 Transcript_10943/m.30942 type:complete len:218 (+) Transcript_10943:404-1057(+)